jgi:hypothetical protein
MLMFLRDARGGCVDVFVVHCCDNVAVVIQSITSDCALLSSLFLSSFPLGCFCVCVCVCVCVCGVTGTGCDSDREGGGLWRLGGRDPQRRHRCHCCAWPPPQPTLVHVLVCGCVRVLVVLIVVFGPPGVCCPSMRADQGAAGVKRHRVRRQRLTIVLHMRVCVGGKERDSTFFHFLPSLLFPPLRK